MDDLHQEPWLREGFCWICGDVADSAEHFVMADDVRSNWGRGSFSLKPDNAEPIKIQGPKSDKLKYRPSLCKFCNSTRTQSADLAWQLFRSKVQPLSARKVKGGQVYLPKLFGNANWRQLMLGVHLYWAKALGCHLAECYERARAIELRQALLQGHPCPKLQLIFFSAPVGEERVLRRTSLNVALPLNGAFFMYFVNSICVVPALTPEARPNFPRFVYWHPQAPGKTIQLHQLGGKDWRQAAARDAAQRLDKGPEKAFWKDFGDLPAGQNEGA